MKARVRKSALLRQLRSQINITPLIDVLLVLIVIFMVITPVTPTGLHTEIPQPPRIAKPPETRPLGTLVLNLDSSGRMTLNRKPVNSISELSETLQDIFKTRSERSIFVQGSPDLEFNDVVKVIDAAVGSGAVRVGLMPENSLKTPGLTP